MSAPLRFEAAYRVRFDETTPQGTLRTGALLGYLQDVAWRHSNALGFTRQWYSEHERAWLVRAIEIEMRAPVSDGDEIRVTTRIGGYRKVMARRVSEILAPDGTILGTTLVDWAMTDGVAPARIPEEFVTIPGIDGGPFTPLRLALPETPAAAQAHVQRLVPRLRELDPMNHVNNGVYADWCDAAVTAAGGGALAVGAPRRLRLEYLRPATLDASLVSVAWPIDGGFGWRLADAGSGEEMARALLTVPTKG